MKNFPFFLKMDGRTIAIVGNGDDAIQRLHLLGGTEATILLFADKPSPSLQKFLHHYQRENIYHVGRPIRAADFSAHNILILFICPDDRAALAKTKQHMVKKLYFLAHQHHALVNAMDIKEYCDFYVPSIVNRAPVVVAIGTEGNSPMLAQRIRQKIEATLPANIGAVAMLAGRLRKWVMENISGSQRKIFWQYFLNHPRVVTLSETILRENDMKQIKADIVKNMNNQPANPQKRIGKAA